MSAQDLRKLSLGDLAAELAKKQAEAHESIKALAAGELKNNRLIRSQRREIATIHTLIAEKRRETNNKEKDNA